MATHHFDDEPATTPESDTAVPDASTKPSINGTPHVSPADRALCETLLEKVIAHFTPILYTPAAGLHMQCTDVFAEYWMPYVIQPSLEDDGVYKPMESLERIKNIDWEKAGLCPECAVEKRKEWSEEQEMVWNLIDEWIKVA